MGRAHWLRYDFKQAVAELEQAVELSPNFALGHYSLAFILGQRAIRTRLSHARTSRGV